MPAERYHEYHPHGFGFVQTFLGRRIRKMVIERIGIDLYVGAMTSLWAGSERCEGGESRQGQSFGLFETQTG